MPELPEVETVRLALLPELQGRKIVSVDVLRGKNVETDLGQFESALPGKTIVGIARRGKYLLFLLEGDFVLMCHLRMEGKLFVKGEEEPLSKHDLFLFHLDDGKKLVYNDTRRFGRFGLYRKSDLAHSPIGKLGKEPSEISPEEFCALLRKKRIPIKEALLDQTLIAGIGNIYADESLFDARISPFAPASSLSQEEASVLLRSAKRILQEAIDQGGSTVKSYHPKPGESGKMQSRLQAYGREGEPCPHCRFPLKKEILGGRGTVYCPICQRKPGAKIVIGVLGPIHSGKSTVSRFLQARGYRLFDADEQVHELYQTKSFQRKLISLLGQGAVKDGNVDFSFLRGRLSENRQAKARLDDLIFPLVKKKAQAFIKKQGKSAKIVLDVPLLFQAKMEGLCDATLLLFCSPQAQRERLEKEGRDAAKLLSINAGYPVAALKQKVSFVLENEGDVDRLKRNLDALPLP